MKKTAIERLSQKAASFFLAFLLACPAMTPVQALAAEDATEGEVAATAYVEPEGQGSSIPESDVAPSNQTSAVEEAGISESLSHDSEQLPPEDEPTGSSVGHGEDSAVPDTSEPLSDTGEGSDNAVEVSDAEQHVIADGETSTAVVVEENSLTSATPAPLAADEPLVMPLAEGDYVAPLGGSAAELSEGTYYVSANVSMMTPMGIRGYATNPANPEGLNGNMGVPGAPATNRSKLVVAADGTATLTVNLLNPVFTVQKIGSSSEAEVLGATTCELELHPESSLSSSEKAEYNADMARLGITSRVDQLILKLNNLSGQYQLADCVEFATTLRTQFTIPLDVTADLANARRVATGDTYTKEFSDASSGLSFKVTVENGSSAYGDVSEATLKVSKLEESTNQGIATLLKNCFNGQPACESYAVALLLDGQEVELDDKVHVAVKGSDADVVLYGFDGNNLTELQREDGPDGYSVALPNTIVSAKETEGASKWLRSYALEDEITGVGTYFATNGKAETAAAGEDPDAPDFVNMILEFYDLMYAPHFKCIAASATCENVPEEIADLVREGNEAYQAEGVYAMAMDAVVGDSYSAGAAGTVMSSLGSVVLGPSQSNLSYRGSIPVKSTSSRVLLVKGSLDAVSQAHVQELSIAQEMSVDKVGHKAYFDLYQKDEALVRGSLETMLLNGAHYLNGDIDLIWRNDVAFFVVISEKPKPIEKPVAVEGLTYNGAEQIGVASGEGYDLSLQTSATEPGTYTALATLKDGYVWSDGSTSPVVISWSIAEAPKPVEPAPAPSNRLAPGTYTVTANLFVPASENDILHKTAYMNNPKNPLVPSTDPNYGFPLEPVSNNAKLVVTADGRYLLDMSLPNPVFTLIELGSPTGSAKVLGVERDGKTYGFNTSGRITRAVFQIAGASPLAQSAVTVFNGSHVYAVPISADKYWSVHLDVDATSAKWLSSATSLVIPSGNQAGVADSLKKVEKPEALTGLIYNGSEQIGVPLGEGYDLSLQAKAIEAGTYTALATLKAGYVWADGTTDPVIIQWTIEPDSEKKSLNDLETGTYTITANLFVPDSENDILHKTAYMSNPKNPLVAATDPNFGLPLEPVSDNAKLVVTADKRYLLDLMLPNPAFTLIEFGASIGNAKVLGVERDGITYGTNTSGRIVRVVIELSAEGSATTFSKSHIYAAPLSTDKRWSVSLDVSPASAKRISSSTAITIPGGDNGAEGAGSTDSPAAPSVNGGDVSGSVGSGTTVTGNNGALSGVVAGSAAAASATKLTQGTYTVTCNIWFDKETTGLPLNPHITSGVFPPKDPVSNNAKLRVDANGRCTVTVPISIQHKVMKVNSISGLSVVDSASADGALSSITVDLGVLSPRDTVVRKSCTVGITMGDLAGTISGITGSKSWPATFQLNFAGVPASGGGTIPAAALAAMAGSEGVSDTQDAANAALAALADDTVTADGSPVATAVNEDGTPLASGVGSEAGLAADRFTPEALERELAANPWMAFALGALCTLAVGAAAWGGRRYYLARTEARETQEVQA